MESIKTKIESVEIGKFDVDSILIEKDNELLGIAFDKKVNVSQYIGKNVIIQLKNLIYTITENAEVQTKK